MHISDDKLLRYVTDDLTTADVEAIEAHVVGCATCQGRLQEHARLEVFCCELGERLEARKQPDSRSENVSLWRNFASAIATLTVIIALAQPIPSSQSNITWAKEQPSFGSVTPELGSEPQKTAHGRTDDVSSLLMNLAQPMFAARTYLGSPTLRASEIKPLSAIYCYRRSQCSQL